MRAVLAPSVTAVSREKPVSQPLVTEIITTLGPPLPTFITPAGGRRVSPVCVETAGRCPGRAGPGDILGVQAGSFARASCLCSDDCADNYRRAMGKRRPVVEPVARRSHKQDAEATLAGRRAAHEVPASDRKALRYWYAENLQPRLSRMHPTEVAVGAAIGRSYAYLHRRRYAHSAPSALSKLGCPRGRRVAQGACRRAV
jgi:hypothetical protein